MLSSEKWLRLSKQSIDAIVLEKVYIEGELRQRHMVTTSKKTHSYHSLIKNSSDIIALINGEGIITYVSPSITPITGYTAEEIVGCYVIFLVHPDDLDTVQQMLGEIGQSPGESLLAEYRLRCKDGSWRWFEGSGTNLLYVPGVEAIVGNFRDISERKLAPHSHWSEMSESEHFVQFYESDVFLLDSLSGFIGTGLSAGDACVVIATKAHRERLEERLKADGLDPIAAQARGQYIPQDAAENLSKFMVDGLPDAGRFFEVIGGIITQAGEGRLRVRAFGEMVALLWEEGNQAGAVLLEELWNELASTYSFSLFCAYPMHGFGREAHGAPFCEIGTRHTRVIPAESYNALASPDERLRAITLLQQKAASLQAEIMERKKLERQKDEFISMASHELKTPVTSLKGFLGLLQRRLATHADEKELHYLARMDTQVQKLTKLINDLLDLSKMQTGQLVYREERFELDALVQEIVENIQGTTQTHRVLLEGQTLAEAFGDQDRIGQVLINLLNNAIKYSPQADRVMVRVTKDQNKALVSVQDFGIGIAKEHQHMIFERFYQVTDAAEKTYPGLGIGLYISSEIVKRHGGQMWVESEKDEGATFHVTLPLYQEEKRQASLSHGDVRVMR